MVWGPDPSLTRLGIEQGNEKKYSIHLSLFTAKKTRAAKCPLLPSHSLTANEVNQAWKKFLSSSNPPPLPTKLYSSPFVRASLTLRHTYQDLLLNAYPKSNEVELKTKDGKPLRPLIKEFFRETIGEHTCDKRGPKSKVEKEFPDFDFEKGFVEEDELYKVSTKLQESS